MIEESEDEECFDEELPGFDVQPVKVLVKF